MGCENDTAMNRCMESSWIPDIPWEHLDFIRCIRTLIKDLPIVVTKQYVDGHKDKIIAFKDLSLIEQLNVHCDSLAKLLWKEHDDLGITDTPPIGTLPFIGWLTQLADHDIVTKIEDT